MSELGPLYHWSPRERRKQIEKLGLVPGKRGTQGPFLNDDGSEYRISAVCASPDAATAWAYSHGCWESAGVFDLWQFWLELTDEVHVVPVFGFRIIEVRIANRIRKKRLQWVGERAVLSPENAGGR